MKKIGRISSIETMGLNDGPGIRNVIFFQGCKLRCKYCHNPETWKLDGGDEMDTEQLLKIVLKYKKYFDVSSGGITCSGGEPLLQIDFLTDFLKKCKSNNIHTVIDTSGYFYPDTDDKKIEELLKYTDLVILDVKHIHEMGFFKVTSGDFEIFERFLAKVEKFGNKLWIRHVVMPGLTDGEEHINEVKKYIGKIKNVEKIEFLPYHSMGLEKYKSCL